MTIGRPRTQSLPTNDGRWPSAYPDPAGPPRSLTNGGSGGYATATRKEFSFASELPVENSGSSKRALTPRENCEDAESRHWRNGYFGRCAGFFPASHGSSTRRFEQQYV